MPPPEIWETGKRPVVNPEYADAPLEDRGDGVKRLRKTNNCVMQDHLWSNPHEDGSRVCLFCPAVEKP